MRKSAPAHRAPLTAKVRRSCAGAVALLAPFWLGAARASEPARSVDVPFTSDRVLASLNQTLVWYRQARVAMRSVDAATGAIFTRDDEQTALIVVQRAFDTARAEAALLAQGSATAKTPPPAPSRAAERRAEVQRAVQRGEQEVDRLRARLGSSSAQTRDAAQEELTAATQRLELDRTRLDLLAKFHELDAAAPVANMDLAHQIQAIADSVPELRSSGVTDSGVALAAAPVSGTTPTLHRLLALERSHSSLEDLTQATNQLARTVDADLHAVQAAVHPIMARLRTLAGDPTAGVASLQEGQRVFQELLQRANLLSAILPPLREESALVRRYAADLEAWRGALDRDVRQTLQTLALGLVGVVIALVVILVGAVLWRVAAHRYVQDAYRRHLVMTVRNVLVLSSIGLVLVFHFASELAALVTGLGFAAAGIAFALQNVILAVAGYFSMMAPNGIRVGDRVGLQGPFGYVQGDVLEIGFVRIRLRELTGEPLRPTGRIVVFSNSVVFTGTFFKHPPAEAPVHSAPPLEPGAAA